MESNKKKTYYDTTTENIKVATINCVYDRFSTGKIIKEVEKITEPYGVKFLHFFEVGDEPKLANAVLVSKPFWFKVSVKLSLITGWQYGMGLWHTILLCRKIKKYNPDIVHIHCPNARSVNLYYLLGWLKNKFSTVITNHAEYFYTGNCAHAEECEGYMSGCSKCDNPQIRHSARAWKKMKYSFDNFDDLTLVTVSPWQKERLDGSVILGGRKTVTILNGIDTAVFYDRTDEINDKYQCFRNKKNIVHVTAMFNDNTGDLKGGRFVLELARRFPAYNFIVVGTVGNIKDAVPDNVHIVGYIKELNILAEYYSLADLSIMTSRRETFGMTLAESLCCGTPVVGFKNGGSDSSAIDDYTSFVDYGELDLLEIEISKWIDAKDRIKSKIIRDAKEKYSKERMGLEYLDLYRQIKYGSNL